MKRRARAGEGIPLWDYIKFHASESFVRGQLDRSELRYTWTDIDNKVRASDDGGPVPPRGWWPRSDDLTQIDEWSSVQGHAMFGPVFPKMNFVLVYPVVAAAPKAPRPGRPSSAPLVLAEAERRLGGTDRATYIRQGRENFLAGLSDWLRNTHRKVRQMKAKTIGDRARDNAKVRALLPEAWLRQK